MLIVNLTLNVGPLSKQRLWVVCAFQYSIVLTLSERENEASNTESMNKLVN